MFLVYGYEYPGGGARWLKKPKNSIPPVGTGGSVGTWVEGQGPEMRAPRHVTTVYEDGRTPSQGSGSVINNRTWWSDKGYACVYVCGVLCM